MVRIMKRKWTEYVKTALIVVLTMSALLLGWRTNLFNAFFESITFFGSVADLVKSASGEEQGAVSVKEAARPLCIVITGEDGRRYGIRYDADARNAVYDRTSIIMGEALGTAADAAEISEREWREALSGPGVYYEYLIPIKRSVLDTWLDAKMTEQEGDILLRRMLVTFEEEKNRLYYQDAGSGLYYCADTASSAGVTQNIDIYSPNGAQFAFETGFDTAGFAPYYVLIPGSSLNAVSAAAGPMEDSLESTLIAFRHNKENYTTSYSGGSGALICIGTMFDVTVSPDGSVLYRLTEDIQDNGGGAFSESELIEKARLIVSGTIEGVSGSAEVFFESVDYIAGGVCAVSFGYYIAGGRILLKEDVPAARITFRDGTITAAELRFRKYEKAEEFTGLLPEIQAMAAAGCEFALFYSDSGQDVLQPFWLPVPRPHDAPA